MWSFKNLGILLAVCTAVVSSQSTFSPARPPAFPLAVKSPYLSTWLGGGSADARGGYLPGKWPQHWASGVAAWGGMVRVDGQVFTWMGAIPDTELATQTSATYTSTKSVFVFDVAGKVELTATFLSPVYPTDYKRQSLIFSYLNVEARSMDGGNHDVVVYTDISGEWVSGENTTPIQWESGSQGDVKFHRIYRQTELAFSEINDHAEWGKWYYASTSKYGLSYQSGADVDVRGTFQAQGVLENTDDTDFRNINDRFPVFGFSDDLGSVGSSSVSSLFTVGLTQEDCVQFANADGYKPIPSLWTSYFGNAAEALEFFHDDYANAVKASQETDDKISSDSMAAAGQDYLTITSLAFRQAFAGTQLGGTSDQIYLWMKEISSNGNFQTVDVFFPMHPILLYTNPELLKFIMEPHFQHQEAGLYPNKYSIHDLGAHYPNATGHPAGDDEPMPLEECGNMAIMALAYAQRANDVLWLDAHWPLLNQWAEYLVEDSLYPAEQLSTDDFAGRLVNQTNLALKGMIGLAAVAQIANLTGHAAEAANYSAIAEEYITQWQTLGVNNDAEPPHSTLNYAMRDSYNLLYNLYADTELQLNLVPRTIYDMQSAFYPNVRNKYGVPLDTRGAGVLTKGDWQMFAAAIASESTRGEMVADLAKWIGETPTNRPMSDLFDTKTGDFPGITFTARPVVGGMFALLALQ